MHSCSVLGVSGHPELTVLTVALADKTLSEIHAQNVRKCKNAGAEGNLEHMPGEKILVLDRGWVREFSLA